MVRKYHVGNTSFLEKERIKKERTTNKGKSEGPSEVHALFLLPSIRKKGSVPLFLV